MKRYKITYWDKALDSISEISISGRREGKRKVFWHDGRNFWQDEFKKGILNGTNKEWWFDNSKQHVFENLKKGNRQGIQLIFQ